MSGKKMENKQSHHFVLVHGACHGAWCWYKVSTLLKSWGHQVSVLDMAASGVNPTRWQEVNKWSEYFEPLMEFLEKLKAEERVIVVGHSMSGPGVCVAMEKFPEKISAAVFVAAALPGPDLDYGAIAAKYAERPPGYYEDNQTLIDDGHFATLLGPNFMANKQYNRSPPEDLELGMLSIRPFPIFVNDSGADYLVFTEAKYGTVHRVFIVLDGEDAQSVAIQWWMIENNNKNLTHMIVSDSDHMAMFSKPNELSVCLQEIGDKYS